LAQFYFLFAILQFLIFGDINDFGAQHCGFAMLCIDPARRLFLRRRQDAQANSTLALEGKGVRQLG
jgi:hypothetical protein